MYSDQGTSIATLINRIRAQNVDPSIPYSFYYTDALNTPCSCISDGQSYDLLVQGIEFHDLKEFYGNVPYATSREHLGQYYVHVLGDSFPARQVSIVILGEFGSGKSVYARQHLQIFPAEVQGAFVFKPTMEDSFPWTGVPPMAKFVDLNDFRTDLPGFTTSGILNVGEYSVTKVPQKSAPPIEIQARLVLTANYLEPGGKWKKADVDALLGTKGRSFGGPLVWKHPLQHQQSCKPCRNCSARFMGWCMESRGSKKRPLALVDGLASTPTQPPPAPKASGHLPRAPADFGDSQGPIFEEEWMDAECEEQSSIA